MPDVLLTPISPPEPPVGFGLAGDAKLSEFTSGSSSYLAVSRPRRKGYTEWQGTPLIQLELPLIIVGASDNDSVEQDCVTVENWMIARPSTGEPPVMKINGPVPASAHTFVLYDQAWGPALRRRSDSSRTQQAVTLTLVEYAAAEIGLISPAAAAQARQQTPTPSAATPPTGGQRTYTVVSGDTLTGIAARILGNYRLWTTIASLNGLRDPSLIYPGQKLLLP